MDLKKNFTKKLVGGALVGAVNGLFGGGGGMIVVPVLSELLGFESKCAHATAILVIAPVCAVSAITYIIGGYFHADVVIPVSVGAVIGGLVGAEFLNKLPKRAVNFIFIAIMLAAGIRMVWS